MKNLLDEPSFCLFCDCFSPFEASWSQLGGTAVHRCLTDCDRHFQQCRAAGCSCSRAKSGFCLPSKVGHRHSESRATADRPLRDSRGLKILILLGWVSSP